ncbi:hypothetical protein BAU15_04920 [Enterococcus sp. JM4C]|uniref:HAD-IIB family hydrolase n=1 Tax=Candidatus Enterococcus huntleyi TaxID=1857217 RepID=UPI001379C93C|nr:HAD family hydrolase [Enterococcus sp. JM4C]KAF1295099.1 hypothetical protein BAU15_04920 [Enterococcus sp. JM4C]
MSSYKAIIFDYDGTIKSQNEQRISAEIKSLLLTLRENNILIFLATGRPHEHCSYLLSEQLVDCIISANGSLVRNEAALIHATPLTEQTVADFLTCCKDNQFAGTLYTDTLYSNGILNENLEIGLQQSMNITADSLEIYESSRLSEAYLLCAFCPDTIDESLKKNFSNQFLSRWHPTIISILDTEVTKATGILKALEYYQITPHECIAVGDGTNDIEMLELSGHGIAVGSNNAKLVAASDQVITAVDERLLELFL